VIEPLFSASWYRVSALRPRLRSHARIHRHVYRGKPWYVLQDLTNQKFYRFTPATHSVIGWMDGERTVDEIWRLATEALGDDAPTQDDVIRLLAQLHSADVLLCDVPPDSEELLERYQRKTGRELWARLLNPFAIRVPLLDPERFLARVAPFARPLVGPLGAALWLAVVTPALVLAAVHWSELSEGFVDRVLTPQNLIVLWLVFPVIKALHELGHGIVARCLGAEVHDMGLMFLVFTPVPYVDASAASALPERGRRALVGAAGMLVELVVCALAMYVWVGAEPGVVRAVAFNAALIGAITTVAFNGNPLLRFDGYYVLADLLEIPNLRARANAYVGYLAERHLLGRREAEQPAADAAERVWLVGYAVASLVYRVTVVAAIFLFVLGISLPLGLVLVAISLVGWVVVPSVRTLRFLLRDPRLRDVRGRAVGVAVAGVAVLILLVGLVPMPLRTLAEGVVWIPDEALARAQTSGFIERVVAQPGQRIRPGDLLIECGDPELRAEVDSLAARLRVLDARYHQSFEDPLKAELVDEERTHVAKRLAHARRRLRELSIRSGVEGVFAIAHPEDLPGRYARKGQVLAQVIHEGPAKIRAVVSQDDVELLHERPGPAQVRLSERFGDVHPARIQRIVPTASLDLPSSALGSAGGGEVAIDPRDERGVRAVQKLFVVELELPREVRAENLGGRVYVRFDHGLQPLAFQWYRTLRQLFLSRLDV
jgi:putative peptide zinc metalloprotease protein